MKTSCISHPENERLVIIRKWQVEFCDGNQCAAALLSFFEYWHSWKLTTDQYNHKTNNISELHGEGRLLSEDIYQYHSLGEMSEGILNLYGEKTIASAIKLLVGKGAISIHGNPNPRFHYDKTKYFCFYPEICNEWIKTAYKSKPGKITTSTTQKCDTDDAKLPDASGKNASPSGKNASYRTEINNKDTQSIQLAEETIETDLQLLNSIITALKINGLSADKLSYPDAKSLVLQRIQAGATDEHFVKACEIAREVTQGKGFGIRYLVKVVDDLLKGSLEKISPDGIKVANLSNCDFTRIKSDLRNGKSWLGDLYEEDE
jgi:hypothetical protein